MTAQTECPVRRARERLYQLSDEISRDLTRRRHACARSREWALIPLELRMALLMMAGIDGDLSSLSRRSWPEFTPAEKLAVQVALRLVHSGLSRTFALRGRAV